MKKILTFLIICMLVSALIPTISFAETQEITLTYSDTNKYPKGTKVRIGYSWDAAQGDIEIYNNGELVDTQDSSVESILVTLQSGRNEIFVSSGTVLSNKIVIDAYDYCVTDELVSVDFSGDQKGYVEGTSDSYAEQKIEYRTDDDGNRYLYAQKIVNKTFALGFVLNRPVKKNKGLYVYEFDFMSPDTTQINSSFFANKFHYPNGSGGSATEWDTPHSKFLDENGKITGTDYKLENDTWYRIKVIYDLVSSSNRKMYIFVDDEAVLSHRLTIQNATAVDYNKHYFGKVGSEVCLDNVYAYFIAEPYKAEFSVDGYESNCVPYDSANITLNFNTDMDVSTLETINLIDEYGDETTVELYPDESSLKVFNAVVSGLKANCNYTVDLSDVKSFMGATASADTELSFKTQKLPFCIDGVVYDETSNETSVSVNIRNVTSMSKSYVVLVGLVDGDMIIETKAKNFNSSQNETMTFDFVKPNSEYKIRVCVFDSIRKLNVLDKCTIE